MDTNQARRRLEEERTRLLRTREGFQEGGLEEGSQAAVGELSNVDQHPADVATDTMEREKDLSMRDRVDSELADIEAALRRIDDGTYGICEVCGRPIGDARLEAIPTARRCVEDQAATEREVRPAS